MELDMGMTPTTPMTINVGATDVHEYSKEHRDAFSAVFGRDYLRGFRDPVFFVNMRMFSPAVQTSYRRDYHMLSRVMFAEYIYRRSRYYDQSILDNFAQLAAKKAGDVLALFKLETAKLHQTCHNNNIPVDAGYLHSVTALTPVIHVNAMQYLRMMEALDQLMQATGSATLFGVISSDERRAIEIRMRRVIRAWGSMIRHEASRLRNENYRLQTALANNTYGSEPETKEIQAELVEAQAMQDSGTAEFDRESAVEVSQDKAVKAGAEDLDTLLLGKKKTAPRRTAESAALSAQTLQPGELATPTPTRQT